MHDWVTSGWITFCRHCGVVRRPGIESELCPDRPETFLSDATYEGTRQRSPEASEQYRQQALAAVKKLPKPLTR